MQDYKKAVKERLKKLEQLYELFKPIFKVKTPLILITGALESGKTDFGLLLAEILYLFEHREIATNIKTEEKYITQIRDMITLKKWLGIEPEDPQRKARKKVFVLDEAGLHISSRRALSKLNLEIIKACQLARKARCKFIFITAIPELIDSLLLNKDILIAYIRKISKTKAELYSQIYDEAILIENIPPTSILFDTYDVAPFYFKKAEDVAYQQELKKHLYILKAFAIDAKGSYSKLAKILSNENEQMHRETARRLVVKSIKILLKEYLRQIQVK